MLQVNFKTFMERVNIQKDGGRAPTIHYEENSDSYTLYFKNYEYWEYFTKITKSEILEFGTMYGVTPEQAMQDFKTNYLTHAVPLVSSEITDIVTNLSYKSTDVNIVEESKDYADFFHKQVGKWKERTINNIDKLDLDKSIDKSFGEFLSGLMNSINSMPFMKTLKKYIKASMIEGIDTAEKDLDIQIGWTETFNNKLLALQNQQLDGYTINGKRWYGIRGATKELQVRILKQVEESVRNKESKKELTDKIKEIFDGVADSQAERIAQTETNRFVNEGKLTAYKESGVKGTKAWSVVPKACCEICERLHDKYFNKGIDYDEMFYDDMTGQSFLHPPAHPNCRCVIEARF